MSSSLCPLCTALTLILPGTQYAYYHDEDETSFQLVDTAKAVKPMYGRGRGFRGRGNFRGRWNNRPTTANNAQLQTLTKAQKIKERDRMWQVKKWQKQQAGRQNYQRAAPIKNRDASVMVKDTWTVVEEMDFPPARQALPAQRAGA